MFAKKNNRAMNIKTFLSALTEQELLSLKKHLLTIAGEEATTRELIGRTRMSTRLSSILHENSGSGDVFEFVKDINRSQFLRMPRAGEKTWIELEEVLNSNNRK